MKQSTERLRRRKLPAERNAASPTLSTGMRGSPRTATVLQIASRGNVAVEEISDPLRHPDFRTAVCNLCESTVSLALEIPLDRMRSRSRSTADIALARQIAMYLAHTTFRVLLTEVGHHFNRDRSTVAHACTVVEDRRDDEAFELMIFQLEELLKQAVAAIETNEMCQRAAVCNER